MKFILAACLLMPAIGGAQTFQSFSGSGTVISNGASPPEGYEMHRAHKSDAVHMWHVLVIYQDGAVRLTTGLTKKAADRLTAKMDAKWWPCGKATSCTRMMGPGDIVGVDEFE